MIINNIDYKFFLAPMAELTTPAFRQIVKSFEKNVVTYSEMLSSGAIVANARHNLPLITKNDNEYPFFYQIVGDKPHIMAQATKMLCEMGCDGIDINMGCSAPHILKKMGGSSLLKDIKLASKIINSCRKATNKLLTVKMRSGFEENNISYLKDFIKMLIDEGINAITIHPRPAKLKFSRKADWNIINEISHTFDIPIIGNGDIEDHKQAINKLNFSKCNGVMIGRAAIKKPWIFYFCNKLYNNENISIQIDIEKVWIDVLNNIKNMLPDNLIKSRAHRFCFYYQKNCKFGHQLFVEIRKQNNIDKIIDIIKNYFTNHKEEKYITVTT